MRLPIALLLLVLAAPGLRAQDTRLPVATPLSDSARVSLLTFYPREDIHTVFGHSAFRVRDAATGLDRVYNYGTFDFDQPFFVLRFVRGQLDYQLSVADFDRVLPYYRRQGRATVEQHLALAPEAVQALYAFLETNYLPENRTYRYDFFFDNCATRLVDAVDAATDAPLRLADVETPQTFRALLQPYLADAALLRLGINTGLGLPTDRVATAYEQTFLPLALKDAFDRATLDGRPLVSATDTLFWTSDAARVPPTHRWPLGLGWALLALGAAATALRWRTPPPPAPAPPVSRRWGRGGDALLVGVVGLAGALLAFLWVGTEHRVTGPNLLLLWMWPTHLVVAPLLLRPAPPTWLRGYLGAAAVAAAVVGLTWPVWPQAFPLAVQPVALLVALRAGVRAGAARTAPVDAGGRAAG